MPVRKRSASTSRAPGRLRMPQRSPRRRVVTMQVSTTITFVRTSGLSRCVRSAPRRSDADRPTVLQEEGVRSQFAMRWICLARCWSMHSSTAGSRRIPSAELRRRGGRGGRRCRHSRRARLRRCGQRLVRATRRSSREESPKSAHRRPLDRRRGDPPWDSTRLKRRHLPGRSGP
jgi:hypothetical protein